MEPKTRGLDDHGSAAAARPGVPQGTERSPIAEGAAAAQPDRDASAEALRRCEAELRRRDAEAGGLRARLAVAEAALEAGDAAGTATARQFGAAVRELQASAAALADANEALLRANADLERRLAERAAALAESETRLRAATDAVPHLVWTADGAGLWTWANRSWAEYTGMGVAEACGLGWLERVHPDDREATLAAWSNAGRAGELRVEHRLRAADGTHRWFSTRALPDRKGPASPLAAGAAPAVAMWYGTSTDVEDARRAEGALRESEARFRGFAETSPDVLWIADASGQVLEYLSPAYEQVWGQPRDAVLEDLRRWSDLLHPEDRAAVQGILPRVLRGERVEAEYRIRRASDGAVRWIRDTGFPILDAAGAVERVAGLAQDVTDRREAERQRKALLHELNHRVKNALAGAQALAAQTARGVAATSPGAFLRAFEERLIALARAHDMLTREGWRGAGLRDVVREALAPHGGEPGRATASGPEVRLVPGAAVALHIAFHELAANAARHGALSAEGGSVAVGWSVERPPGGGGGAAPAVLDVSWRERGGPPIAGPPAHAGFGTRFLEKGLARQLGGETRFAFAPEGLEFRLRLPLSDRVGAA